MPGATPPIVQNAQTDTPGRALTTNINGTNRNNNVTRIDGAASINVWLPHHAGYIAPVETIENVNISTNSFDAAQGMTGGAATAVQTKSGTNNLKGSAFFFRQQDELNARRGYFDPSKLDASVVDHGRHRRRSDPAQQAVLLRFVGAERRAQQPLQHLHRADRADAAGRLRRSAGVEPSVPDLRSGHRAIRLAPAVRSSRTRSFRPIASARSPGTIQALYPAPNNPGTNNGLQNNLFVPRLPKAIRDNYDLKMNWNRNSAHQIWGKFSVMDADVHGPVLPARRGRRRRRHDGVPLDASARPGR